VSLYYTGNYRTEEQLAQMRELEGQGICVFCPQHLPDYRPVVHRTPHWTITTNRFPYRGTRLHYLLLPDEHVEDLVDLSAEAHGDFWNALRWARDHHGLTYYGLASRNGDCAYTGATIRHVHVHLVQGDVEDPGHSRVRVTLSSHPRELLLREIDPHQHHPGGP
jgi:diadenosine tetraphosphate (Ap4A) HIT family hydrolase